MLVSVTIILTRQVLARERLQLVCVGHVAVQADCIRALYF